MATNNSWNNQINNAYNQIILNAGTNGVAISTDASAATINVATGAAVKTTTVGSTNSTSATTVQSGSGALNVTATNGALTVNSGTGALSLSSDASATTVNLGTGAAAKTVTVGSTTSTSLLALKYGTADFTLASATGTVMSALDTGEITYPLQPAFLAYLGSQVDNVTGDGTGFLIGTTTAYTEVYDQGGDFDTAGTFTAPITGRYLFTCGIMITGITSSHTRLLAYGSASNRQCSFLQCNPYNAVTSNGFFTSFGSYFVDMDSADTIALNLIVYNGTKVIDVFGDSSLNTFFGGALFC